MNQTGILITAENDTTLGVLAAEGNDIGGLSPGSGNVISGNSGDGIQINSGSLNTSIFGNLIGTDYTGKLPLKNGSNGISIYNSPETDIGFGNPASANTIANNGLAGILINASDHTTIKNDTITGNYAGIDIKGTAATDSDIEADTIKNNGTGIILEQDAGENTIGGAYRRQRKRHRRQHKFWRAHLRLRPEHIRGERHRSQ